MDQILSKIEYLISNFALILTVDTSQVQDFKILYELEEDACLMFFYRGKHIKVDVGSGNNNKIDFVI